MATGYLYYVTDALVEALNLKSGDKAYKKELLKKLTKPFTNLFIQLDKKVLYRWSMGEDPHGKLSLVKKFCDKGG